MIALASIEIKRKRNCRIRSHKEKKSIISTKEKRWFQKEIRILRKRSGRVHRRSP